MDSEGRTRNCLSQTFPHVVGSGILRCPFSSITQLFTPRTTHGSLSLIEEKCFHEAKSFHPHQLLGVLRSSAFWWRSYAGYSATRNACKNNLRQFGIGIHLFADKDPQGRYCTGAYDFRRDGCPDTWGWVADLVNINAAKPQELICPSNPLILSEKINDMLGKNTNQPSSDLPPNMVNRLVQGLCGTSTWGGTAAPAARLVRRHGNWQPITAGSVRGAGFPRSGSVRRLCRVVVLRPPAPATPSPAAAASPTSSPTRIGGSRWRRAEEGWACRGPLVRRLLEARLPPRLFASRRWLAWRRGPARHGEYSPNDPWAMVALNTQATRQT
jgi:hypothetical protein